jgi:hypothetical protein
MPLLRTTIVSLRGRGPLVIETVQRSTLQPGAKDMLDAPDHRLVVMGDQREGVACLLGPAGATDPMGIGIRCVRHIIIDDMGDP